MTFVITQNCCTDASCIPVCPVDCIRPVPGKDGAAASMLYIDPKTCVDCGVCAEVCPVNAIYHEDELPSAQARYKDINADYFAAQPLSIRAADPIVGPGAVERGSLKIAVVGTGPAACYTVTDLARTRGIDVNVFEKLPTPFGLIRAGVAPDHQRTKDVIHEFEPALGHRDVTCFFNVKVGQDVTHEDLMAHHHAVIYAVGASRGRELGIPGEHLLGNHAASDIVGWYNGHPDHITDDIDLSGSRAVIIGNGNVALDVARILLMEREALAATDIAEHALAAIQASAIDEVVVLGRRGAADAAFSASELLALTTLDGVDVVAEGDVGERPTRFDAALKYDLITELAQRPTRAGSRRIVLRFGSRPVQFHGNDRVEGLEVEDSTGRAVIPNSMVVRSIGYRGAPIDGLPFDAERGIVPNVDGRVVHNETPIAGVYVTGWIKRGPRGVIGTNRACAQQTVTNLLADARSGVLATTPADNESLSDLIRSRGVDIVDWDGWRRIDAIERERGNMHRRPRIKVADVSALLAAAAAR